jgi:hypothetical protein
MDDLMEGRTVGWMGEGVEMHGRDGWKDGWVGGWIDGWVGGWMDG